MSNTSLPVEFALEILSQLPREGLVNVIVRQQQVIEQQQKGIEELEVSQSC